LVTVKSSLKKEPTNMAAHELSPGTVLFVHSLVAPLDEAKLSPAEREVAELILRGRDNASIAAARGTSVRTIANQVASLFAKLGVRSRAQFAAKVASAHP
jgi:DNA-binding CsgD family transcriptional regulator